MKVAFADKLLGEIQLSLAVVAVISSMEVERTNWDVPNVMYSVSQICFKSTVTNNYIYCIMVIAAFIAIQ